MPEVRATARQTTRREDKFLARCAAATFEYGKTATYPHNVSSGVASSALMRPRAAIYSACTSVRVRERGPYQHNERQTAEQPPASVISYFISAQESLNFVISSTKWDVT